MDGVQYEPSSFMNRNRIKTAVGPQLLSVPVLSKGYLEKPNIEIPLDPSQNWQKKHWSSIKLAYIKSPYFESYKDFFVEVYTKKWNTLCELNENLIKHFFKEFKINIEFVTCLNLGARGTKSDRIIDICKKMNADLFIFGSGGKNYADIDLFKKEKIKVYFQNYVHPIYPQLYGEFIPNLSVLDLLFNCGEKTISIIMSGNISKDDLRLLIDI
jgi:hypothetical protein